MVSFVLCTSRVEDGGGIGLSTLKNIRVLYAYAYDNRRTVRGASMKKIIITRTNNYSDQNKK